MKTLQDIPKPVFVTVNSGYLGNQKPCLDCDEEIEDNTIAPLLPCGFEQDKEMPETTENTAILPLYPPDLEEYFKTNKK